MMPNDGCRYSINESVSQSQSSLAIYTRIAMKSLRIFSSATICSAFTMTLIVGMGYNVMRRAALSSSWCRLVMSAHGDGPPKGLKVCWALLLFLLEYVSTIPQATLSVTVACLSS